MLPQHLLVTGGNGYIGRHLVAEAVERGWFVTFLSRSVAAVGPRLRHYSWTLGQDVPAEAFSISGDFPAVTCVMHLAHDWQDDSQPNINVTGSTRIFEAGREHGARIVFCSSISARPEALNRYGRVKAEVEALLRPGNETSARIGMVYGGAPQAMWGTLCKITALSPVLPMLEADKPVQPIHVDDLCWLLAELACRPELCLPVYGLAAPQPLPFGKFLEATARHRHGRALRLISIPLGLALSAADVLNRIPGLPKIDRERILGLAGLPFLETADSLSRLGMVLRPLEQGLAEGVPHRWRRALREASALLSYVSGVKPSKASLRRYVRSTAHHSLTQPLNLPDWVLYMPAMLRLFEPMDKESSLSKRLYLAALIAEAAPESAASFHDYQGRRRVTSLLSLARIAIVEAVCMPLRLLRRK